MFGGLVEQDEAEERDGDGGGADDHVFPGGFQGGTAAVVADQESGNDGGGLDRDPQHAEVAGQHGSGHRGDEQVQQDAVPAGPAAALAPGDQVGRRGPAGQQRHRRDPEQHPCGQGIGADQAAGGVDRSVTGDGDGKGHHVDGQQPSGHDARPGAGAGTPARGSVEAGGGERQQDRGEQEQDGHQSCSSRSSSRSLLPNAVRSRVVRTCNTRTTSSRSKETPSSTISGTPAAARNAVAVIPLSSNRNSTTWDSARRRVTSVKNPVSTTSGRVTAYARRVRVAAASREAAVLTRGRVSRASAGELPRARRARYGSAPARSMPSPPATRMSSMLCWWMPRIATMAASAAPCSPNRLIIGAIWWRHSTPIAGSRNRPAARSRYRG